VGIKVEEKQGKSGFWVNTRYGVSIGVTNTTYSREESVEHRGELVFVSGFTW